MLGCRFGLERKETIGKTGKKSVVDLRGAGAISRNSSEPSHVGFLPHYGLLSLDIPNQRGRSEYQSYHLCHTGTLQSLPVLTNHETEPCNGSQLSPFRTASHHVRMHKQCRDIRLSRLHLIQTHVSSTAV